MSLDQFPALNASLNGLSAIFLALGFACIKLGRKEAHRRCMMAAVITSCLFLVCYLIYHFQAGHTSFQNPAWFRKYYLALLASHVLLAVLIVPLVLATLTRAFRQNFPGHKKIARWTWPIWMYVSVTGVIVYFLLYHIYPQGAVSP
jgi:uncharacterized membrane protein YozB (DUF420 family)